MVETSIRHVELIDELPLSFLFSWLFPAVSGQIAAGEFSVAKNAKNVAGRRLATTDINSLI